MLIRVNHIIRRVTKLEPQIFALRFSGREKEINKEFQIWLEQTWNLL